MKLISQALGVVAVYEFLLSFTESSHTRRFQDLEIAAVIAMVWVALRLVERRRVRRFMTAHEWVEISNDSGLIAIGRIVGQLPKKDLGGGLALLGAIRLDRFPKELFEKTKDLPRLVSAAGAEFLPLRLLTDPTEDVVMGKLQDQELQSLLENYLRGASKIALGCTVSSDSVVMVDHESIEQFETIWAKQVALSTAAAKGRG